MTHNLQTIQLKVTETTKKIIFKVRYLQVTYLLVKLLAIHFWKDLSMNISTVYQHWKIYEKVHEKGVGLTSSDSILTQPISMELNQIGRAHV